MIQYDIRRRYRMVCSTQPSSSPHQSQVFMILYTNTIHSSSLRMVTSCTSVYYRLNHILTECLLWVDSVLSKSSQRITWLFEQEQKRVCQLAPLLTFDKSQFSDPFANPLLQERSSMGFCPSRLSLRCHLLEGNTFITKLIISLIFCSTRMVFYAYNRIFSSSSLGPRGPLNGNKESIVTQHRRLNFVQFQV